MKCNISGKPNYFQPVPLEPYMLNECVTYWLLCPVASGAINALLIIIFISIALANQDPPWEEHPRPVHNSRREGDRLPNWDGGGTDASCPHTAAHMAGPAARSHVTWSRGSLHLHLNRWQLSMQQASHSLWELNQAATRICLRQGERQKNPNEGVGRVVSTLKSDQPEVEALSC